MLARAFLTRWSMSFEAAKRSAWLKRFRARVIISGLNFTSERIRQMSSSTTSFARPKTRSSSSIRELAWLPDRKLHLENHLSPRLRLARDAITSARQYRLSGQTFRPPDFGSHPATSPHGHIEDCGREGRYFCLYANIQGAYQIGEV